MSRILILADTNGTSVLPATLSAIAFAQAFGSKTDCKFDILIVGGSSIASEAASWTNYGADKVLTVASDALEHPSADQTAAICSVAMNSLGSNLLIATSTSFGRDVLPHAAALLDLPMVSDVIEIVSAEPAQLQFRRPMYAGNIIATVAVSGNKAALTIRGTAFNKPVESATSSEISALNPGTLAASLVQWISHDVAKQSRPDSTVARVVVSGGRPLKDADTFETLIGGLADRLGGAVGATRAAVDAGIAPNELQVGQTGKVVAPDLYIAAGISGSVQHLAGMKESKVIVAINTDPDAPMFQAADYALQADLFLAIPELMDKL